MENKTKRQLYERIEAQMTGRSVRGLDLEPVSYTHLDVYKRQR